MQDLYALTWTDLQVTVCGKNGSLNCMYYIIFHLCGQKLRER